MQTYVARRGTGSAHYGACARAYIGSYIYVGSYIYGPNGQSFEQVNNSSGAVTYLHHYQQGSTRLLTNSIGKEEREVQLRGLRSADVRQMQGCYRAAVLLFLVAVVIHIVRGTAVLPGKMATTILIGFELATGFAAVVCAFRWALLTERLKRLKGGRSRQG
jgi:hypothetical protein